VTALGPNDLQACPSLGRLKSHRAHGITCFECEPDLRQDVRCPLCLDMVPAVGAVIEPHDVEGRGRGFPGFECPGSGAVVELPVPVEQPLRLSRAAA